MANENLSWVRWARIARLGLGGVIVGSFVGVYLGALAGAVGAAWTGQLATVLDGAVLGAAALALLGGGYGTVLGVTESPASPSEPLKPTPASEMEHAHGR